MDRPAGSLDLHPPDPLRLRRRTIDLGLAPLAGERAAEVLDAMLDLIEEELRADGIEPPARPA